MPDLSLFFTLLLFFFTTDHCCSKMRSVVFLCLVLALVAVVSCQYRPWGYRYGGYRPYSPVYRYPGFGYGRGGYGGYYRGYGINPVVGAVEGALIGAAVGK